VTVSVALDVIDICELLPLQSVGSLRAVCKSLSVTLRGRVPRKVTRSGRRVFPPIKYVAETAYAHAVRLRLYENLRALGAGWGL
jgi:hypothetical protein